MKNFEKTMLVLIVIALFGILGSLFIKKIQINRPEIKYLTLDDAMIKNREKGICADMYAEGFNWGLSQYKIDFQTSNLTLDDAMIKNREKGICADMYAEGFNWGLSQYKIDFQTSNWSYDAKHLSEQQRAMEWWKYWKEVTK